LPVFSKCSKSRGVHCQTPTHRWPSLPSRLPTNKRKRSRNSPTSAQPWLRRPVNSLATREGCSGLLPRMQWGSRCIGDLVDKSTRLIFAPGVGSGWIADLPQSSGERPRCADFRPFRLVPGWGWKVALKAGALGDWADFGQPAFAMPAATEPKLFARRERKEAAPRAAPQSWKS